MTSTFKLKNIFDEDFCELICDKYGFKKNATEKIAIQLENIFRDFIILILSENNKYTVEERNKLYNEAIYNLEHTSKLLKGMPHPASSMSYKLIKMSETLKKVTSGDKKGRTKANRFIEKNLVRKFIVFWDNNNPNKFSPTANKLSSPNKININVCKCFLQCSKKISSVYPEIEWFRVCEIEFVESLFENI